VRGASTYGTLFVPLGRGNKCKLVDAPLFSVALIYYFVASSLKPPQKSNLSFYSYTSALPLELIRLKLFIKRKSSFCCSEFYQPRVL
jgi:hypothetical protein